VTLFFEARPVEPPPHVLAAREERWRAASEQSAISVLLGEPPLAYSAQRQRKLADQRDERPRISAVIAPFEPGRKP
jgi:hypothetical protein